MEKWLMGYAAVSVAATVLACRAGAVLGEEAPPEDRLDGDADGPVAPVGGPV
jgi:hypothetical protein